jgi:aspartate kinase
VDIFTDVLGVAKVDPRIVATAPLMEAISYEDMYELADNGAKVIHPRAVKTAQRFNVPVRVRSTFSDHTGTLISDKSTRADHMLIGMALEKSVQAAGAKESMGRLFLVFDRNRLDDAKKQLDSFFAQGTAVGEATFRGGSASILLPSEKLIETTQKLYGHFVG